MKQKKIFGVMAIALSLVLAACGTPEGSSKSSSSKHTHTWGAWEAVTAANCTEKGSEKRTCSVCLEQATREVAALGHLWGETVVITTPGVGIEGSGTRTCSRCQLVENVTIPALAPTITIDSAELIKLESKVYIRISGTEENFTEESFVWAFGLKLYNSDPEKWMIGSAAPTDEEFDYPVAITPLEGAGNEHKGTYTVDFDLTSIVPPEGVDKAGMFNVYAGPKGLYSTFPSIDLTPGNKADSTHNFYFRSDSEVGSVFTLCADDLPPYFHLADAMIEFRSVTTVVEEVETTVVTAWAKIFGEALDQSKTVEVLQAELDLVTPYIRFQTTSYTRIQNTTGQKDNWYFEVKLEEGKLMVYLNIKIQFVVTAANNVYNTHLNLKNPNVSTNCVMEGDFEHVYDIPDTTREIVVFSHPAGANNRDNSYGNLGWRTRDKVAA